MNPQLRPAEYARALGITRSAVHQIIRYLEINHDFRIRGHCQYDRLGLVVVFGWAESKSMTTALSNFGEWLSVHPSVYSISKSILSSNGDFRVYFEALFRLQSSPPLDRISDASLSQEPAVSRFIEQLRRFEKKPYSLAINYSLMESESNHLNLAMFDGKSWTVEPAFRLRAILDAVSQYADILPSPPKQQRSLPGRPVTINDFVILSGLIINYHISAPAVHGLFKTLRIDPPSIRTIRRRLSAFRGDVISPYVQLRNVGLSRRFIVTIYDSSQDRTVQRIFHAQAEMFPQCRVVSGKNTTVLDIRLPSHITVPHFSSVLSALAHRTFEICIFETQDSPRGKALEEVLTYSILNRPIYDD